MKIGKILAISSLGLASIGSMCLQKSTENVFAESAKETYELVKTVDSLEIGKKFVIANSSAKVAMSATQSKNNRAAVTAEFTDNTIDFDQTTVQVIELGGESGKWTFSTGSCYLYAASSSKNYLKTKSSIDDNCKWNITIDSSSGNATILAQGSYTHNSLRYNSPSKIFSCYSSGQMAVQLFKEKNNQPEIKFSSSNSKTIDSNSTGKFEIEKNMILDTDEITWSSSNENVLQVTGDGEFVADEVKENTNVTIKVVVKRENVEIASASLEIVVLPIVEITNVTISSGIEASLKVGDSLKLTASVEPSSANQNVVWSTDNDKVCSVDENGNVKALEGNATIKATSASDSSKSASILISVSYLTIKEARAKAPSVTVKGVVTSVDTAQNQATIQDDTASILLFRLSNDQIKSLSVGKIVRVTGESLPYNGLAEITNVLTIDVLGDGTVPAPIALENTASSDLTDLDSTIFFAEGKLKTANKLASSDVTMTLILKNEKTIPVFVKQSVASTIASSWNAFIDKAGTVATIKIIAPLSLYKGDPQLSMLPDMSKVESVDVDAVDAFVNDFMHPEIETTDSGTGKCSSEGWYLSAKEAYGKLSENQKKMFDTLDGYKDMKARFDAWAAVADTGTGLFSISSSSNNNSMIVIVCMSLILIASVAGYTFYRKRRA